MSQKSHRNYLTFPSLSLKNWSPLGVTNGAVPLRSWLAFSTNHTTLPTKVTKIIWKTIPQIQKRRYNASSAINICFLKIFIFTFCSGSHLRENQPGTKSEIWFTYVDLEQICRNALNVWNAMRRRTAVDWAAGATSLCVIFANWRAATYSRFGNPCLPGGGARPLKLKPCWHSLATGVESALYCLAPAIEN